jgi:molecular chaperone GrpE
MKKKRTPSSDQAETADRHPINAEEADATSTVDEPDYREQYQRALADWENARKRWEQEKQQIRQYGQAAFCEALLPVVDNFYRATEHVPQEHQDAGWVTGIQYIQKQLLDVLEREGVVEIPVKPGDPFDPHRHEAVATAEAAEQPENTIVAVNGRGYFLHGRVLRPVRVTVASGTGSPEEPPAVGQTEPEILSEESPKELP